MNEADIVRALHAFYAGLFPKVCANCGRSYPTLRDYVLSTSPLWPTVDYDVEMGNQKRLNPAGGLAMANCVCGSTLALSSKEMPAAKTHLIFAWVQAEANRRGWKPQRLLDHLRDEVRALAVSSPGEPRPRSGGPSESIPEVGPESVADRPGPG